MIVVFVFIVMLCNVVIESSSFCYWNVGCPYKCFSSKTPYNFIRGDIRDSVIHLKGCEPVSIWAMMRHGKTHPGPQYAIPMKAAVNIQYDVVDSYAVGRSSFCAQDIDNLRNWPLNKNMFENPNSLTTEGKNDMKNLGERLIQAFPKLLRDLKDDDYEILPVSGQLMEDSARAFIKGFNDAKMKYHIGDNSVANPFKRCERYQREIIRSNKTFEEAKIYAAKTEYNVVKDRIQRRSGILVNITHENIVALYDLCRYDSSGYENKFSPWCALFTTEDLKVLNYESDLKHYYRNGYGSWMSELLGRVPLVDLLESFKQVKEGNGNKFKAHISHSTMLDMMYTALGLFKDDKIQTSAHRNPNRKWKNCKMSTFSSNFVAVLNRCSINSTGEYNVLFYLNEEPIMSVCNGGVCSWQDFEEKLTFENVRSDFCSISQ